MVSRKFKNAFLELEKSKKMILIGSFLAMIACLLPWYEDLDSYGAGELYLGITGPLFLIGFFILVTSLIPFILILLPLAQKKIPRLPVKPSFLTMFVGIESLFLLLIANSIYFHPKFGVNITLKDTRFGMILAFAGLLIMVIGGYLESKKEPRSFGWEESLKIKEEEKKPESLIKFPPKKEAVGTPQKELMSRIPEGIKPQEEPKEKIREKEISPTLGI